MRFASLPTGKLHKKPEKKRLKNFAAGYVGKFYWKLPDNVYHNFLGSEFYGKIVNDYDILSDDVQKYILATSDFAKGMQSDINKYVTKGIINNASFRQKVDLISKNIIRRQYPLELVFEDISTFDIENPIVGSLLKEIDVGKKDTASELIKKSPRAPGVNFTIRRRLDKLKDRPEPKGSNNNISPPPSPPPQPPPFFSRQLPLGPPLAPAFVPPPSGWFLEPFKLPQPPPWPNNFISILPAPSAPPLPPDYNHIWSYIVIIDDYNLLGPSSNFTPSNNLFGSQTQTLTREREEIKDKVQKELDDKIYELPDDPPKLELGDSLANIFGPEAEDILDEKFVNKKELEDEALENIKEEYGFEEIKDAFDEGSVPNQLDFFYGGSN